MGILLSKVFGKLIGSKEVRSSHVDTKSHLFLTIILGTIQDHGVS